MTPEELQAKINIIAHSRDGRDYALEIAYEAERLMKENESLRGYNAQCDLIAVENARLWKEKTDSLLDWAALWKRKAKELYRVVGAFDEEHASVVTSNMRLANENGIMREALENLANPNAYENENIDFYETTARGLAFNGRSPHEFAQAILSRLEKR